MRLIVLAGAVSALSCAKPPPGVLTLAPSVLTVQGTAQRRDNGGLQLESGASASTEVFLPRGETMFSLTIGPAGTRPAGLEVWLGGDRLMDVTPLPQAQTVSKAVGTRREGAHAIRLQVSGPPGATVELEKLVLARQ